MPRFMTRSVCFFVFLFTAGLAMAQTEFSADIIQEGKEAKQGPTKVYFGKDKMRFDPQDAKGKGAVIMNLNDDSFLVVMPAQHMYMVMPAQTMENRGMFNFFKTGDVDNACSDWLKLDENKGGSCHKVGGESVNGRNTVKYEGTNAKGESSTVWLDSKLRFPVKWNGKNGGGEMRNIQEGSQPASLFEPPAGFTKMDMGAMMQRNK